MKPIKIMHFADVHFGMETYGKLDPETGLNSRLSDFKRSLEFAIDKAIEADVDLAVFAGDAYKTRDPNQTHQREFASCIRRLTSAGVPVVMVTGNHDLPNSKSRANAIEIYRTLGVDDVHIVSKPEIIRIDTKSGPVQVAGMPYLLRSNVISREDNRARSIQETTDLMVEKYGNYIEHLAGELDPAVPSVLLGHFWIKNAKVSSQGGYLNVSEPEVLVSVAANQAFDYVAMGHIHKYQDLNPRGTPPVVYCGSVDRIDFSERGEEKGFVLVDLEKGNTSYQFVQVPARRFVEIDVNANADDPTEQIIAAVKTREIEDAVVKLVYHISQDKAPMVRDAEIREALAPAFMVVSVTKDVARDTQATRSRMLNESLDPVQALDMFFDTKDDFHKRKSELMEYAKPLIDELLAEEQTI